MVYTVKYCLYKLKSGGYCRYIVSKTMLFWDQYVMLW
jgi:hypothetical protein